MIFWEVDTLEVDFLGVDILGVDILGVDILGVDILGRTPRIVPASWQALKLILPAGRNRGNTVYATYAIQSASCV